MEYQITLNLLNEANDSKFVTRKWNIVNNQSNANYDAGNEIVYNTEVLKSNLCDYNDVYILLRGNITIIGHQATKSIIGQVAFRDCASFTKCIIKFDGTTTDDAENLVLIIPMHNIIEYSSNYSETTNVYGFIQKMKQLISMQILPIPIMLNLSCIRVNY